MNEPAVRLEEQIISLFSNLETELYQGWILKQTSCKTVVYPLYGDFFNKQDLISRIKKCEEISRQKSLSCEFRIVEHTNYYLASLLEDNGYKRHCHIIAEQYVNEWFDTPNHNKNKAGQERKMVLNKIEGMNVAEKVVTNNGSMIGIMRYELLYLPNGKLSCEVEIEDIFQFAAQNQVSRILADISDNEKLLVNYRESGFHKAYLYRCYQKEDL
ncbi:MAG: hypothetical protein NC548_59700 [Lachnospiraceae bacterium]|nr:hypothetical protein [Lachnospiraceae bacterium]